MTHSRSSSSKRCWLVTGGCGFIGSHFIRDSLAADVDLHIVNLDKLTYAACPLTLVDVAAERYQLVQGDINDAQLLATILAEHEPQALVHFAAESHVDRSIDAPQVFIHTNINGTQQLLSQALQYWSQLSEQAQQQFRFLQVSTDEVYGSLGPDGLFSEDSQYRPNSPYAASKAAADHLARAWQHTYGLPVIISNCSNNYGSHQYPEKLIPLMTLKAAAGAELPVYGQGTQVRDWLHVSDHVRALQMLLARGQPGRVYNVGGDNEHRNIDIVQRICDLVDEQQPGPGSRRAQIRHVMDRPGHDQRYAIDASRMHTELGWRPQVDFVAGLRAAVHWYLQHPQWVAAAQQAYQGQRLGQSLDQRLDQTGNPASPSPAHQQQPAADKNHTQDQQA